MSENSSDSRILNGLWLPVLVCLLIWALGCTNAELKQWESLGSKGEITCYSGGVKIYQGKSTGKIVSESQSDGWFLEEEGSNDLILVSGDCVIRN